MHCLSQKRKYRPMSDRGKVEQSSLRWIAGPVLLAVILVIAACVIYAYRAQIFCWHDIHSTEMTQIDRIPVTMIDGNTEIPEGWTRRTVGPLEFYLPSQMTSGNDSTASDVNRHIVFEDSIAQVVVKALHEQGFGGSRLPNSLTASNASVRRKLDHMTLPQLRLAAYSTDASDFRWSTTVDEAWWHHYLMKSGAELRATGVGNIRGFWTHFSRHLQIGAQFGDSDDCAIIEWESAAGGRGGYMHIQAKAPGHLDEFVRALILTMQLR